MTQTTQGELIERLRAIREKVVELRRDGRIYWSDYQSLLALIGQGEENDRERSNAERLVRLTADELNVIIRGLYAIEDRDELDNIDLIEKLRNSK